MNEYPYKTADLTYFKTQFQGGHRLIYKTHVPAHVIFALVAYARSEGSDETVQMHSLDRAFTARILKAWM